jgi:uncharacterized protein (DUF1778 family)
MTQEPRRKRRRKPPTERKRNNLTFRVRDQLKADLEKAAAASNRSVSEEIEFRLGQAFQWEKVLGDIEAFKLRMAEAQRQTEAAARFREGWGKMYDPSVPGGVRWFPPGTHNIPQSGFEDPNAPPPQPGLPPILRDAVQSAVRDILAEAGLLPKKKSA